MATFRESEPHEAGFAAVFAHEIAPKLARREERRRALLARFLKRSALSAGVLAAVAAVVLLLPASLGTRLGLLWPIVVVGLLAAWFWIRGPWKAHKAQLRDILIQPVCRFLGDLAYTRQPNWGYRPLRFRDLGVVPKYSRAEIEDMFEGRHRGTGFRLAEVKLIKGRGRHQRTVFKGLLFEIEVPVAFEGRILMQSRLGAVSDWLAAWLARRFGKHLKGLVRLDFADRPYDGRFLTYASHPDEARRLLTADFRATMAALPEVYRQPPWRRHRLAASFADGSFYLALPMQGDLFEVGSLFRSAFGCERDIRRFMRDIVMARRVIDYLHGDRPQ